MNVKNIRLRAFLKAFLYTSIVLLPVVFMSLAFMSYRLSQKAPIIQPVSGTAPTTAKPRHERFNLLFMLTADSGVLEFSALLSFDTRGVVAAASVPTACIETLREGNSSRDIYELSGIRSKSLEEGMTVPIHGWCAVPSSGLDALLRYVGEFTFELRDDAVIIGGSGGELVVLERGTELSSQTLFSVLCAVSRAMPDDMRDSLSECILWGAVEKLAENGSLDVSRMLAESGAVYSFEAEYAHSVINKTLSANSLRLFCDMVRGEYVEGNFTPYLLQESLELFHYDPKGLG